MTEARADARRGLARTDPASEDQRLRGRTYAIPFQAVWTAAIRVAELRMRGWSVASADDETGLIQIEARTLVWKIVDDVTVSVGLDYNAQTRVDVSSAKREGGLDLGRNARKIGSFLKKLDAELDPRPGQILDPTLSPQWRRTP